MKTETTVTDVTKEVFETVQVKKYMRISELAVHLSLGKSTLWKYRKMGIITSKKIGGNVTLFEVAEVEKALFGEVA